MSRAVSNSKIPGFDPRRRGGGPHYETWYGKVDVPGERALWFRYKTLDGVVQHASTWAVWFDEDEILGGKNRWWLADLRSPGHFAGEEPQTDFGPSLRFQERYAVFRVGDAHLDDGNALGSAGPISWDLHWRDSGRRFSFVPPVLERVGIARSTYENCFADLRVTGRIRCAGESVEFDDATGMVGHIQGSKIAGHSWAWSHCNNFDGGADAVFEGLSARALIAGRGSPLMTALFLVVDDRRYEFHGPVQAFRTESDFNHCRWTFTADDDDVRLTGTITAPSPERMALVRYTDTDGSHLWCHNSKLASLRLNLVDRKRGMDQILRSTGRAAYETVTRDQPVEVVLI